MDGTPIPREVPLPLPLPHELLQLLVVLLFLAHILFVNLMIGGTVLAVYHELRWLLRGAPDDDRLARELASTVTVSKSLAVVLGVGPLLLLNLYYTVHFYSANVLTGNAWIMVVPLVAIAFLLTYAYRYSWDLLAEQRGLHLTLGLTSVALFLVVPLIFLANVNLMLFPARWREVEGFLSALALANVLPRYLHFLLATMAVTGLVLAGYFGRQAYPAGERFESLDRTALRRRFLGLALGASALQLIAGPLLFLTLPAQGMRWDLALVVLGALALVIALLVLMWRAVRDRGPRLGRSFWAVVAVLTVVVVVMGAVRHIYREIALEPHQRLMAGRSATHRAAALAARMRAAAGIRRKGAEERDRPPGERVFETYCSACHARGKRLVGPSLEAIAAPYAGQPQRMVEWIKDPGDKRPDYPTMPAISLDEDEYAAVARHVLQQARR